MSDDVGGPTVDWPSWFGTLENEAVQEAGFELLSDLPVYDYISSEGPDAELVEKAIHDMWKQGLSPAQAVEQMKHRDEFWTQYIPRGSMQGRG